MSPALIEPLETRIAPAAVTISLVTNSPVQEGSSVAFVVSLDGPADGDVVVNLGVVDHPGTGYATEGADFFLPGPVVIATGETSKQFTVTTIDDVLYELDESFEVKLTSVNGGSAAIGLQDTASATIAANDQDQKPTVSMGPNVSLGEGNSGPTDFPFSIVLDKPSGVPITVHISTQTDTGYYPADWGDYTPVADDTVTIPAGQMEVTYNVQVTGDTTSEPDETFLFKLGDVGSDAIRSTSDIAIGTILDDESARISIDSPVSGPVAEGSSQTLTFKVHLNSPQTQDVTVTYSTVNGTAVGGSDFNAISGGTLNFLSGETEKTITIPLLDDSIHEQPENFYVHLQSSNLGTILGSADTGTGTINDNDPAPLITISGPGGQTGSISIDEGDSPRSNVFTLSLDRPSSTPFTVHISSSEAGGPHLATEGVDYVKFDQDITFAAGETTKTISLNVLGDTTDEFNEALTLTTTARSGDVTLPANPTVVLLGNDDVKIDVDDASIIEGNSGTHTLNFPVTLSAVSLHDVTFNYTTSNGTATGSDFTGKTGTVTIAAGQTTGMISIDILGDTLGETDEFFNLTLSAPTDAVLTKTLVHGTILNDDNYLSISDAQVIEGGAGTSKTMVFTVTLFRAAGTPGTVTMDYKTADSTATAGADYTAIPITSLTFAPNETTKTISVTVLGDASDEQDETVKVTLSNVVGMDTTGSKLVGTGTIIDDENLLVVSDASLVEGDFGTTNMFFTVSLVNRTGSGTVTVNYATADGTATAGSDYTAIVNSTLTFATNETSKTIVVPILGDRVREGNETFALNFSNPGGASLATTSVTGTITDNDPLPVFSINGGSVSEDGGSLIFSVNLNGTSQSPVMVDFNTADGTATLANIDYTATTKTLTFLPGQTFTTVSVPITADNTAEGDETVLGKLSNAQGATIAASSATGVAGTILEDDIKASVSVTGPAVEGNTGTTTKQVTITLDHAPAAGHPVTIGFTVSSLTGDTAVAGTDYVVPAINTVTFQPGELTKTFDIEIKGDNIHEGDEKFTVALTSATNAVVDADPLKSSTKVTIADDDGIPMVSIADASFTEGNASAPMTFTLTLSNPTTSTVTVHLKTLAGTAGALSDFIAINDQLVTFAPGQTTQTVTVQVVGDQIDEPTETFTVELSNPSKDDSNNPTLTLGDSTAIGTILDNDLRLLSVNDVTISEGNSGTKVLHFTVSLSAQAQQTVTVHYFTEDDTATNGSDYFATSGTLTFFPSETSKTVDVTIQGDTTVEPDEHFLVRLSADSVEPLNAIISDNLGIGTIQNDESQYSLGAAVVSGNEEAATGGGDNTLTFTVKRTGDLTQAGSVIVSTADGTATSTGDRPDFVAKAATLVFAPGESSKPFTVTLKHDLNFENDETFSVQLSDANSGNGAIDPLLKVQTGKILNNDVRPIVKIVDAPATVEGALNGTNKLNFTVQLVTNVDGIDVVVADETEVVTVKWHTVGIDQDETLTARGTPTIKFAKDYEQTVAGMLIFAGETSKTISIPIVGDNVDEDDEAMAVIIDSATGTGVPTNLAISRSFGHGLILDDDAAPVLVFNNTTNGDYSFSEGSFGDSSFHPTLQLFTQAGGNSTYSEKDITFTLTLVPGTATAGSDYAFAGANQTVITIPAGETMHALDFTVFSDVIHEADETFSLQLSNPHNVRFSDPVARVTIVNDDAAPTLAIGNAQIVEGDSGQASMIFTVTLQGISDHTVTVKYATADGTGASAATSVGGLPDFLATAGTLSFAPGETSKTIAVPIFGDPWLESDETFTVSLWSATNANIATATGIGTILNGSDSVVGIIVQDASGVEDPFTVNSDGFTTQIQHPRINFTIQLTKAIDTSVTFLAQTRNGTAVATGFSDADYVALGLTQVTIAPGQTSTTVQVEIRPDFNSSSQNGVFEPTENFFLGIGGISSNAGAARAEARGTIFNDDFVFLDAKTLLYVDEDGDLATAKISKGSFSAMSITFGRINQATGGRTLQLLDFTGNPKVFNGTSLSITAEPQQGFASSGRTTDGQVNVGFIRGAIPDTETLQFSHGLDFNSIVVQGDVAKITAGDKVLATPAIAGGIKVKSLGVHTDTGAPNTTSQFFSTIKSLQVEGEVMGIVQVLGNQFGGINSLKIGGALRGTAVDSSNNPLLSGVIAFTGTLKSATIGDIIGGDASDSGSITAYTDFTARIGTLHVLGDIVGGTGTRSGGVVAKSIGSVTVDGSLIGGGDFGFDMIGGGSTNTPKGSNSGVIRTTGAIGKVQIGGDLQGGIQSTTGLVVSGGTLGSMHLGGSLFGGSGVDSGAIVVGQNLTTLVIDGDIVGSSGERSATVQVGTAQNLNDFRPPFSIFIKSLTVGKADGTGGDIRGGSGVDSGTITSGAGFYSGGFSLRGGTIGNALIYGDIIGGTGEGGSSSRTGDSTGGVQAGSTITKLDIRGSIIGGDSPGATASVAGADLVRSGFVVAGRIAQMIVGGDLVAGHDFGFGLADSGSIRVRNDIASLVIRGNVIGNETNPAVISAGFNGPVVKGKASPAIGSLTLGSSTGNSVSFLNVLAGYGPEGTPNAPLGTPLTADVQIGTVNIKGDMKATNIVAGARTGIDGSFGTDDDLPFLAADSVVNKPKILSSIAKVIIGGNVLASDDSYGIVAELVSSVVVQGTSVPLARGASNDSAELGIDTKVMINEVGA
jgi:hypothetical protein